MSLRPLLSAPRVQVGSFLPHSGLIRNFGQRIKSISASLFTTEEIANLTAGGNQAAERVYLATYAPEYYPFPSQHDSFGLREFMRLKYEKLKWYKAPSKAQVQVV